MTPPTFKTRLLGHAVVVYPVTAVTLGSVYLTYENHDAWPATLVTVAITNMVMKANQQVAAYRAWKRAWDGMGASAPAAKRYRPTWLFVTAITAMVAGGLLLMPDGPTQKLALGWTVIAGFVALIIAVLRLAWRRLKRRRSRNDVSATVSLCVRQPLLPVPSLDQAYAMLPEHCQRMLSREPS